MARKLRFNDEGDMAKAQLQKIEKYANTLNDMIHPEDELEAWVQSKLTRAATDLGDIKHYLDYALKEFGLGGSVDEALKPYEVEFLFDSDDLEVTRLVVIHAHSEDEAAEITERKYSPYYGYFEIVSVNYADNGIDDSDRFKFTFKTNDEYWNARNTGFIPDFDMVSIVAEYPSGDELEIQVKTEEEFKDKMRELDMKGVKIKERYQNQDFFDIKDYGVEDDDDYEEEDDDDEDENN